MLNKINDFQNRNGLSIIRPKLKDYGYIGYTCVSTACVQKAALKKESLKRTVTSNRLI